MEGSSSARTSRSTELSRIPRESRASAEAAGSVVSVTRAAKGPAEVLLDEHLGAEALLQGRRTYEFFAALWPSRGGELAIRMNSMPKYVVSSTLAETKWTTPRSSRAM